MREAAARVVDRALASKQPLDGLLREAATGHDARDADLLRELVLGSVRWLRRLDRIVADASGRSFGQVDRRLRSILRVGAYQLLFLDRIPAYAVVDEAVEAARRRSHARAAGFVNRTLRRIAERPSLAAWPVSGEDPVTALAIETSHPDWLVRRWLERFGREATAELLAANNRPRAPQLLAFEDRGGRERLAEELAAEGVATRPAPLSPFALTVVRGNPLGGGAFARGDFYVQDAASQAAALRPWPRPGERVLDAAAAPGGKSFALLAAEPAVEIVAADRSPARLVTLRENAGRLRRRLALLASDAGRSALAGCFDRVVLDLPCSGTGTLRQHPELKWRLSLAEVERLAGQGGALLAAAAVQVAPGGILVAITCSLEREENEEVVERFLEATPGFRRLALEGREVWRVLTCDEHDGFTVQVLKRHPPLAGAR